jgi:hypothetical protein
MITYGKSEMKDSLEYDVLKCSFYCYSCVGKPTDQEMIVTERTFYYGSQEEGSNHPGGSTGFSQPGLHSESVP